MKRNLYQLLGEKYVAEIVGSMNLDPEDFGIKSIKVTDPSKPERPVTTDDLMAVIKIVELQKSLKDLESVGAWSEESDIEWRDLYRELRNSGLSAETVRNMIDREKQRNY